MMGTLRCIAWLPEETRRRAHRKWNTAFCSLHAWARDPCGPVLAYLCSRYGFLVFRLGRFQRSMYRWFAMQPRTSSLGVPSPGELCLAIFVLGYTPEANPDHDGSILFLDYPLPSRPPGWDEVGGGGRDGHVHACSESLETSPWLSRKGMEG